MGADVAGGELKENRTNRTGEGLTEVVGMILSKS